jgi:hypothetical protein
MSWTITSGGVPAAIAGVAPLVDYRFAVDRNEIDAVSLTDKLTVTTVDADGTFVNQAGLIQQATTNIPRFDHGPASRQSLGLLVEDERTNLVLQSENFGTTWDTTHYILTANAVASPSGDKTAYKPVRNTSNVSAQIIQNVTCASNTGHSFSCFAKAAEWSKIALREGSATGNYVSFNLTTETVISTFGATGTITPFPNGWYRVQMQMTTGGVQTTYGCRIIPLPDTYTSGNPLFSFAGDNTSGLYIWGAQLEVGSFPTSYIPTTTTATTRSADDIKIAAGLSGTADVDYTIVEKPAGCVAVSGSDIVLNTGFTAQRVMVFPGNVSALRTAIRAAM